MVYNKVSMCTCKVCTYMSMSFNGYTVDWEYFIGSKLAWEKYSTSFNFMKLARVVYFVYS